MTAAASSDVTTITGLTEGDTINLADFVAAGAAITDFTDDAQSSNSLADAVNDAIARWLARPANV